MPGLTLTPIAEEPSRRLVYNPRESLVGPAASGNDAPTITSGIASDLTFNESYAIAGNALPPVWPVDAFGWIGTIAANTFAMKTSSTSIATTATYRMMTNANELVFYSYAGVFHYDIWVNGRPYASNPLIPSVTTGLSPYGFTKLAFPTDDTRLIEIRSTGGLVYLYVKKPYRIWKPSPDPNPTMTVTGDSYVQPALMNDGAAGSPSVGTYERGMWQQMPKLLGITGLVTDGVGGTGYLSPGGSNRPYTQAARKDWVVNCNPKVHVGHGGGANDFYNGFTLPNILAAATDYWTEMLERLPDARMIYMEGYSPPSHPFNTNYIALREGLQAALPEDRMYYIDIATTRPPISGTGYVTATNGSGNSDNIIGSDGAHYTIRGGRYLAGHAAQKVRRVLADDGSLAGQLIF